MLQKWCKQTLEFFIFLQKSFSIYIYTLRRGLERLGVRDRCEHVYTTLGSLPAVLKAAAKSSLR